VLEIGTGTGTFRQLVAERCRYTGADLQPLDGTTLALDIESDPVPPGPWDAIVLLGVLEYLYDPLAALTKIRAVPRKVVMSYCLPLPADQPQETRHARGWVNALSESEIAGAMGAAGFTLSACEEINAADDFRQRLFVFER
jgi:hypothetical protein